ncbi:dTDP-4-dehydrorhamnose 3,5-epimerase [Herbaspirillum seropedicae]|jgi:dTDP-4-dehydrorhamnose 3,5-epimerase|uniref:dTDP-4-dehydrorhamnose 3,5-epimerase n=2 Tax=Herbaspirillum seropedicae TaxID=964 RepID=D8IVS0_HERSS|nr:dTDP-4-dehydrorhamnose 3,5-epimerase [Herbaspirillum seropedicae]ACO81758.1 RfbC [Herbaspirillum seropedicae SmR1]ADJ65878.1 dTDP-6-deoxy-D-glucose-3,5 epimerase protein [Herbaspirillum seropedicae SmR1]AKN67671.1 dTDP-4-dehydrorhamnose 3,5-epimerase [Herbaspirillum seropedicae]MDR6397546.1 dTDP-4-dehydrorhamnose 3,5-epimerase [Herbaspirillum seropedicae]NQE29714.1 dTDP-4-dehydrorhamnose 3,5-epimerase [Herbaspirillum seropedicae]
MKIAATLLPGVLVLEPTVFEDARGHFFEAFNARQFKALTGLSPEFVQDNQSHSKAGVLRGLHYQLHQPQGKLVRVIQGEITDVVVDLRRQSPSFGQWASVTLSAQNRRQLWIPEGFAHGFHVRSDIADVQYKTTAYWSAPDERCIRWDDPDLAIDWQLTAPPLLSDKDRQGVYWRQAELFP